MRAFAVPAILAILLQSHAPARAAPNDDGSVYHADQTRSGSYLVPGLTWNSAATMHHSTGFDGTIDGNMRAEPLYWLPPGASHGLIIAATDKGVVEALDSVTGHEVWKQTLGTPFVGPICGHKVESGVSGTPAIDRELGIAYMDASLVNDNGDPVHRVFAIDLLTGNVLPGWPVDVGSALGAKGISFPADLEGQRGAVQLFNGRLYIPYGGNSGDCGNYHGMVVGVDVIPPGVTGAWVTRAEKGGIWSQGGVIYDGKSLFVTTGNAVEGNNWADGEAVIRLTPDLQHSSDTHDYFVPSNFADLDAQDFDLGGTNPVQIDVNGPDHRQHWLLQIGKDGNAYVLRRSKLGGIGGALLVKQVAMPYVHTGPARYETPTAVFVAFTGSGVNCPGNPSQVGLTTIVVSSDPDPVISTAWCASLATRGSPIVTTTDGTNNPIVWLTGAGGGDRFLHGYRLDTGDVLFAGGSNSDKIANAQTFSTILAVENRLFVAGGGRIYAFDFSPGL